VPPYAKLRRPRGGIIGRQANRLSGQAIWVECPAGHGTAYGVLGGVGF